METSIDLLQFFNTFTVSVCIPTFILEQNSSQLSSFDLSQAAPFRQPVLLLSSTEFYSAYNNYSNVVLPSNLKYRNNADTTVGICSYIYYFDLARLVNMGNHDARNKLESFSWSFLRIPTSYRFLVAVVPKHEFYPVKKFLDGTSAYAKIKIFLIQDFGSGETLRYYCLYCPSNHKFVIKLTSNPNTLRILTRLVEMEQKSLSDYAQSLELGRLIRSKNDLSSATFAFKETYGSPSGVEKYLMTEYGLDKFTPEYFTLARNSLKVFTLPQLLDFILLEDGFYQNSSIEMGRLPFKRSYTIPQLASISNFRESDGNIVLIVVGAIEYNFITCDGIEALLKYQIYISPLDGACWWLTVMFLIVMAAITAGGHLKPFLTIIINLIGAFLEKPILMDGSELNWVNKTIFCLWIWSSLILNTGWKSVFTTEVITPIFPTSQFKSFPDLINFTFYFPIDEEEFQFYDNPGIGSVVPQLVLILQNLLSTKSPGISNFAKNTLQRDSVKGYTRIRPLAYNHPEHFMGNLTKFMCKKVSPILKIYTLIVHSKKPGN